MAVEEPHRPEARQAGRGGRDLVESEEHVDWLETQLFRIEKVGIQNYLAEQMGEHDGDSRDSHHLGEALEWR